VRMIAALAACLALAGCSGHPAQRPVAATPTPPSTSTPAPGPSSVPAPGPPSTAAPSATRAPSATGGVPRFAHVVIAVFENHGYGRVIGSTEAPYLNQLAATGLLLTDSHGVTHPSEPNYLALFSGSTQGVTDDSCPRDFAGTANLGSQLAAAGYTFAGYSEGMPAVGYRGCGGGDGYARKHNPWVDFTALPAAVNRTFAGFPTDFGQLPSVSVVVPNLCDDMHDCSVATGDGWAAAHLAGYARWAGTHNSLLIVTWDEDEGSGSGGGGHIPTILAGAHLAPGRYGATVDHYTILRTVEAAYGLPGLGAAASRTPIAGVWH
jgi:phosphatidylinositol-3-phosphatase